MRGIRTGLAAITARTQDGGHADSTSIRILFSRMPIAVPVTGISVTPETATLNTGSTLRLNAAVLPANATNRNVIWSSSNPAAATVDASGLVRGVGAGSATITATTADGGFTDTGVVSVGSIPVTGISVTPETATLNTGSTLRLNAAVLPANATNRNVIWSSSNPAAATVDASGLVRGVGTGSTTITVMTADGGFTDTSVISIMSPAPIVRVTGITLTPETVTINTGEIFRLNATISPVDATNRSITWTSSNSLAVSVAANGTIRGLRPGTAVVFARTQDGNHVDSSVVRVIWRR